MHHPQSAAPGDVPPSLVRAELDRILASEVFSRSDRLSAFLKFIVEQTLDGHGDTLKEQVIAVELYGKGADFNTAADPIVRVDARRLRDKLREYYASAPNGSLVISVPKGSYTPVFQLNGLSAGSPADVTPALVGADPAVVLSPPAPARKGIVGATRSRAATLLMIGGALLVIAVGTWVAMTPHSVQSSAPPRLLTVTSLPGAEENPSLSPDGTFVAFSWEGPAPKPGGDIWVKSVDADAVRQLTNTPDELEKYPAWSPDGQYVAFTRMRRPGTWSRGDHDVFMVSALGGPARMVAERASEPSWLPDGRSLVIVGRTPAGHFAILHHMLETGARRQLTEAPTGFAEKHPSVSPDGSMVAFQRDGEGRSAPFVIPLNGGTPTQIGAWSSGIIGGLTWTPDGNDIIFARPELSGRHLVRVRLGSQEPPVAVPDAPHGSVAPSVSRPRPGGTYRLAFVSGQPDVGLRMIDLNAAREGSTISAVVPFCDATRQDVPGRFSPDGTQVAFVSDRGGAQQIWVAARDGTALRSVTGLQDAWLNVGSWSPDSRSIAFDAMKGGNTDIYVVRADGGPVKRLTESGAAEIDPEWSRDGRWIYYSSNESGAAAIWRMPAGGGTGVQLASEVGYEPRESPDGQSVYFIDYRRYFGLGGIAKLKRISTAGGAASAVDVPVHPGAWDVTDTGIVFVMSRGGPLGLSSDPDVLALYDFADHRVRQLGQLGVRVAPFGTSRFLIVSRDGRWAVASHVDSWNRDVMVLDNFR